MTARKPIGIFDSGLGGISIYQELIKLLPREQFLYLADSKNAPYGNKPKKKILDLSRRNTEFLLGKNAKAVVVACNTATTQAITDLRKRYDVPIIGVEPAVKPAAEYSKNKRIGILATEGTLRSNLFQKTFNTYGENIQAFIQVGTGLVELIEKDLDDSSELEKLLESYIRPMMKQKIDVLVLGCTHYPFLIPLIHQITHGKIKIFEPAAAVAAHTKRVLNRLDGLNPGSDRKKTADIFYTTGNSTVLSRFLKTHVPNRAVEISGKP